MRGFDFINGCKNANASVDYNLGYILQLYNVLVQIRLTASKNKRDIYYGKLGIRVASQVAE